MGVYHYLALASILFSIGLYGVLAKRNAIIILMCLEIMLNAVNIAMVAFWRFLTPIEITGPTDMTGQVFSLFILIVAAAEAAVGVGIIIAIFRSRGSINSTDINLMKW